MRETLPLTATVADGNSSVQVDNSWFDQSLREYERLLSTDPARAEAVRSETTERLQALSDRLAEMREAPGAQSARKDEDKATLAAILRRDEYNQKPAGPSALARLWKQLLEWLARLLPRTGPPAIGQPVVINRIAEIFVIALALAAIIYVGSKLAPRFLGRRRGGKREKPAPRIVLGERLAPGETAADLLAQAEALARAGDIRGAIRKAYIGLLCELADRKILRLAQSRTNRDYLRSLRDHGALYRLMQSLTDSFETHWYGFAPATENDWIAFRSSYQQALNERAPGVASG